MIPIFKPYMPAKLDELNDLLHSGSLSYSKWGKMFEERLKAFIGVDLLLTTNSYNSAILVLISTFGLKPGDEILASPVSCLASNQPFIAKGLKVRWVDIDPHTGTMDPQSLSRKISKDTKAIFHNHHCGIPGHIEEINSLAKQSEIYVIDDCIEAFGSEYKGCKLGNTGADAAIFSFQTVRLPNTIEGGAIAFKDPELYKKASLIRDYGIDRAKFRDKDNEINSTCDITSEGYGALMSEVSSYLGCKQMDDIPNLLEQQRENAFVWKTHLLELFPDFELLGFRDQISPNFWVLNFLTNEKLKVLNSFRRRNYYASGIHINNDIYSVFGKQGTLKGVNEFIKKHLALPCGWWLDSNKISSDFSTNN